MHRGRTMENPAKLAGSSITTKQLASVVMSAVVLVTHCVGWNGHTGHNGQSKDCDHQLTKFHHFPPSNQKSVGAPPNNL